MQGFFPTNESSNNGCGVYTQHLAAQLDEKLLKEVEIVHDYGHEPAEDKIRIFWCHEVPENDDTHVFADKRWLNKYHKFVFSSYWQMQRFEEVYGLPHNLSTIVIENGFESLPESFLDKKKDTIDIVYAGAPWKGLDIAAPVFNYFSKEDPSLRFHIFYLDIGETDEILERVVQTAKENNNIKLYTKYTREDFLSILGTSHIYVLPTGYRQVSGRALIESMSAGLVCVHPDVNNLPEISGSLNVMYHADLSDYKQHAGIFAGNLNAAIDLIKTDQEKNTIRFNKAYADSRYNMEFCKNKWSAVIRKLLEEYPDIVSRKIKHLTSDE